ncbi:DUF2971 domain-containing protein [Buttiauxella izardii]|uniref:DUF2971 domain-containing protein n=1 Tax=Buttiauxella izardii TaxID=82991 RepID=A0A3A5K5C0_9ENTR|nr:DUF2971 domain-containing protein [Buttiauxella izardii]RJT24036.1 DUF2971 domain-containing protein [Buttiauxella izardii]
MTDKHPEFLYKYRSINLISDATLSVEERLKNDYSVQNLLDNKATFSSRLNFNDLFDSKIELVEPTPQEFESLIPLLLKSVKDETYLRKDVQYIAETPEKLEELKKSMLGSRVHDITSSVDNGKFTNSGIKYLHRFRQTFNDLIDSYAFISLSSNKNSNLMWSHYADSHKGFCIEFKGEYIAATEVTYEKEIPKLNLIDLCKMYLNLESNEHMGVLIWQALRTKLVEWEYESEYRFQLSNDMAPRLIKGALWMNYDYTPDFVESIIFGWRMPVEIKNYIIEHMPPNTKFKQAYPDLSTIEIMDYQEWLALSRS